jgi:hypothetical protein
VEGSVDPGNGYVQETLFNQSSQAGNYITEDKISFKSGGFLSDSDVGLALIKDDGTNYKDLKATRLYADELYEMQVLKVFDSTDRYSFKVTSASSTTTFLGFNPNLDVNHDTPDMGSPVTFNIQAITGSTTPAKLILGDTNVGDSALVMSGTHVGIGRSSDTTAALAVAGNVSFTGSYGGTYGYTTSFTLDSNTGDFSNKNIFNSKSFTLAGTSTDKYNLIAIANASLRCTDTTQTVSMSISVDGVSSLNSIYSSTTENQDFPLMNIWSGELTGGSHTITVTVTAGASVQIRPTDSSVGEGATLVLVAVPKGDS